MLSQYPSYLKGFIVYLISTLLLLFTIDAYQFGIVFLLSIAIPLYLTVSVSIYQIIYEIKNSFKGVEDAKVNDISNLLMIIFIIIALLFGFVYAVILSFFELILLRNVIFLMPIFFMAIGILYFYLFKRKILKIKPYVKVFTELLSFFSS